MALELRKLSWSLLSTATEASTIYLRLTTKATSVFASFEIRANSTIPLAAVESIREHAHQPGCLYRTCAVSCMSPRLRDRRVGCAEQVICRIDHWLCTRSRAMGHPQCE
ncbi:uncharacterized protein F5Z01DRAFT_212116 [Emericellopsis atlantica]|uniref:Uncharacterized protein n=1 Tax=Emericellopsis atlantica TaxID=2614577 RepID=A0A9P8CTT5_9HYPO|nr:uncharacterized protein F5Z01DRAFT_212116 [Emericellopsis atlantica]KAG9258687.1 hypothetical protein F5Z01DRAFT_212116 [Emericellopsis atlantica]